MKEDNRYEYETILLTSENIDKLRIQYLESIISESKIQPVKKNPVIKQLWFNYWKSKRTTESHKKLEITKIKRVLIFRYDALGDYIVTTPIISFLKKNNPNIEIDIVTSKRNNSFIQTDSNINDTYIIEPFKRFSPITNKSIKLMRKKKYDIIFALVFTSNTRAMEFAYRISHSAHKIALSPFDKKDLYLQVFNTVITSYFFQYHHAEMLFKTIQEYFGKQHLITDYPMYVPITQKSIEVAIKFAQEKNLEYKPHIFSLLPNDNDTINNTTKYVIINITGFAENRKFNIDTTVNFTKYLAEKYTNIHFFITGEHSKKDVFFQITNIINCKNCSVLLEEFPNYIAILAGATLLISPDTAPIHLAAAMQVPNVGIYISELKIFEWHPYCKDFTIVWVKDKRYERFNQVPDINLVDTQKLIEAAEKYL